MTDAEIIEYVIGKNWKKFNSNRLPIEMQEYLLLRYDDSESIAETFYRILHKIDDRPVCVVCGGHVKFKYSIGFNKHCCNKCSQNDPDVRHHIEETLMINYGVRSPLQSKEIHERANKTTIAKYGTLNMFSVDDIRERMRNNSMKKYGVEHPSQSEIVKEKCASTNIERYGCRTQFERPEFIQYNKDIMNDRYGVDNIAKSDYAKNKALHTNIEKYGCINYACTQEYKDKCNETSIKKYGTAHPMQNDEVKQHFRDAMIDKYGVDYPMQDALIRQRKIDTCINKYGVEHPMQCEAIKDKMNWAINSDDVRNKIVETFNERYNGSSPFSDEGVRQRGIKTMMDKYNVEYPLQHQEFFDKMIETKKANNILRSSIAETKFFNDLKKIFPDALSNHKTEQYPFLCDCYIPSLDLYIELNYFWTHNDHFYNPSSKEDNDIVFEWESKNNKFYENAIETWTQRDMNKHNTAIKNNLNYLVFWTEQEGNEWLSKIKEEKQP